MIIQTLVGRSSDADESILYAARKVKARKAEGWTKCSDYLTTQGRDQSGRVHITKVKVTKSEDHLERLLK